ncbi:MAG: hypothetical protein CMM01_03590 [Rhodopirellula sp.]|nr:hypothetical protein [Rhodopirellula sp.]
MYCDGLGVPTDYCETVRGYRNAAKQMSATGQCKLDLSNIPLNNGSYETTGRGVCLNADCRSATR